MKNEDRLKCGASDSISSKVVSHTNNVPNFPAVGFSDIIYHIKDPKMKHAHLHNGFKPF